jgi:hypothetical protein
LINIGFVGDTALVVRVNPIIVDKIHNATSAEYSLWAWLAHAVHIGNHAIFTRLANGTACSYRSFVARFTEN